MYGLDFGWISREAAAGAKIKRSVHARLFGGRMLFAGYQKVTPGTEYYFDGMRRNEGTAIPVWSFQLTLKGWGMLKAGAQKAVKVPEGHAFCVMAPSSYRYYSDENCPEWEFLWVGFAIPEINTRMGLHPNLRNVKMDLRESSELVLATLALCREANVESPDLRVEEKLFHWLIELERWAVEEMSPDSPQKRFLEEIRERVRENVRRKLTVGELAKAYGMSLSGFSEYFKKTSGTSPKYFIRDVRMNEAIKLLRDQKRSIKEVAAATGFADSNHFCKAFRRQFHMSPGYYRSLKVQAPEARE